MPKIIDHDQRRRDIIEVAKRLILQGGFEAATMRSLATEAGFANGALKHYFPGKESIIAATFQSVLAEIDPRQLLDEEAPPPDRDPVAYLREAIDTWLPSEEREINAGRVLLVLWEHAASNGELAELYRQFFANWGELITRMLRDARGDLPALSQADLTRYALEIRSVVIGANVVNLMHPDGQHIAVYGAYVDDIIRRVISPT
ncbi:TetR/AcrR family transcriptional regulator [Devosia sp.]|uniref:TetR/AcrR family transcriptional regulator n=1 Tax=Devosia sp. TaxID=1871048 RepID=UPI0025F5B2E2|nr:TetR/AcrR family transcriptional regulator [Devosia sp.]MCR6633746.1 TetR/AcrR family transcriptional regulator [Devosia sp.]